ncbi:MAG TPA: glycosyltransferase N-terminal domain-containing protein [Opitutaceae bacterium]|nr:glycosyltransferase N-terminal domain-containing protein [Opitutaceae bacterium]
MLLGIYRLLFAPAALLLAPYYLWRMRRRGGYAKHFSDRWGCFDRVPARRPGVKRIWIQAVSVGEMLAIGPLLERLVADATLEVVLTCTTSTGMAIAEERYARRLAGLGYFPLDAWPFSRRTWRSIDPDLMILTEGERWPEHLAQARKRRVPVLCVNARLSDRSYRRMRRIRWAVPSLMQGITRVVASSTQDAARFVELGFEASRVSTVGNLKLDITVPPLEPERRMALLTSLGFPPDEPVLLGSSTWPGEESALLSAYQALRNEGMTARLLLVPRHAERRGEIVPLLQATGLTFHVRSTGPAPGLVDIALADTTGELRQLTQLAEVVFVGKSLPPHHEGQTPIEAAAVGKPILMGPEMSNFRPIATELTAAGAAMSVGNGDELGSAVVQLWRDANRRQSMAAAARAWHRGNQGALDRTLRAIHEELDRATPAAR